MIGLTKENSEGFGLKNNGLIKLKRLTTYLIYYENEYY